MAAPDIPTAAEKGFPDLTATNFMGIYAPAGTPQPVIERISRATGRTIAHPLYRQLLIASAFDPETDSSPAKLARRGEEAIAQWEPIVKALGLKLG